MKWYCPIKEASWYNPCWIIINRHIESTFYGATHPTNMVKPQTISGLGETLTDLEKQLEKAEEKYRILKARRDAVHDALLSLQDTAG